MGGALNSSSSQTTLVCNSLISVFLTVGVNAKKPLSSESFSLNSIGFIDPQSISSCRSNSKAFTLLPSLKGALIVA